MEAELQPRLDTRSRHSSLPPIRVTESPASGAPPADGALALEDGLQIHNDHQRGLDEFRSVFNNKMKNKPVKHDHVHVLIWTWGERLDDLKVKEEVDRLEQTFKIGYKFSVQREKLDDLQKASHELNRILSTFMRDYDNANTLLIFYYAGHGTTQNDSLMMIGTTAGQTAQEKKRNNIAWEKAEGTIKAAQSDVFVIFDCCYAGSFGGTEYRSTEYLPFQCLAACAHNERTKAPGEDSFTSALIWALEKLRPHHPFTSKALLEKIKQYDKLPRNQHPKLLRRDEKNDELVWIAPKSPEENGSAPESERRDVTHEHLDLRFKFWRGIDKNDAEVFAKHMSSLVNDVEDFQAKQIVVLDKTSTQSYAVRTISSGLHHRRKRSGSIHSRNRSPIILASTSAVPAALGPDTTFLPISKRIQPSSPELRKRGNTYIEPESVAFHLRMALHYLLQKIISQIIRIAERILPVQKTESRLSDMD